MRRRALALCLALTVADLGAQVPASTLTAAELWFDANASLGPFRGVTKAARGSLAASATLAGVHGFVEMQATTLTTNNGLRDHDMKKTLEVEKFPVIRFDLDSVSVIAEAADSSKIELVGRMTIHGVTKPLRIPSVLHHRGRERRVTGSYELFLPAYGVTKLKRMLGTLSMKETIRVGLDVTFTANHEGSNE